MSAVVTFAQAQERAEEWVNGEMPGYQHREVRVREFELGFVVWAEDRADGPTSDGGRHRLVIARDSGEVTLWPGLPVGEVVRRYEEEYGTRDVVPEVPGPPQRIDLHQTSFLLSPPEWLQDAADRIGVPDRRDPSPQAPDGTAGTSGTGGPADPVGAVPAQAQAAPGGATPWAGTDTNAEGTSPEDGSVPLPATVFGSPLSESGEDDSPPRATGLEDATPPRVRGYEAPTAPLPGPRAPGPALESGSGSGAADIAEAATRKASPPRSGRAAPPPPPGAPGVPGVRPSGAAPPPPPPVAPDAAYAPTQMISPLGADGPGSPGAPGAGGPPPPPGPPGAPGTPPGETHLAETMLGAAGAPSSPPGPPRPAGPSGPPGPPRPPGAPGAPAGPWSSGPPAVTGMPGPPPVPLSPPPRTAPPGTRPPYGAPAPRPTGLPTVGPGYQAVLSYRAPDGSEAQLIRRSAPGTPHPEWQILHELRALNVPPQQVLELHTELESCELPGGYCARMIRETWPQVRITSVAPYGQDHAGRQQGMRHLLTHQGELHQVADGPARPVPMRAPLPQMPPAPPVPPEGVAQELMGAFGPQGICRFDQRAVARQGVPEVVARTLVWAGLPADFGPFFWAQPPLPVVPTLAELAAQRQVRAVPEAASYLVVGSDFGRALCVQYGTSHIMAVPVEAEPAGRPVPVQFVNTGLPEFTRCLALLGRMWRLRFGLNPEQAGRWTVDFQAQLAALDPAALSSQENWWSVLLEQMWDGLL